MYSLKIFTKNGVVSLKNVEEFVTGILYFYCRYVDGSLVSIPRSEIITIERKLKNGKYKEIKLKKFKKELKKKMEEA